jgi:tRNA uridine 5-carboxymethylaminomethyl modification enzyme
VQWQFVRSIKGFEHVHITRPGYAIEYDYFDPRGLTPSLQTKALAGLFFAGQINGTTGYEEAAAQGLIAGINAALKVFGKSPFVLSRSQSYIGILIDDLVTRGVDEPYRMFTSRAEYRLLLRIDNADQRLMPHGFRLGLVSNSTYRRFQKKWERIEKADKLLRNNSLRKSSRSFKGLQRKFGLEAGIPFQQILKRPEVQIEDLGAVLEEGGLALSSEERHVVQTQIKYEGYILQQLRDVERLQSLESRPIPSGFKYEEVSGLSREVVERLGQVQPDNLGQASRIPGITPAAMSILSIHLP